MIGALRHLARFAPDIGIETVKSLRENPRKRRRRNPAGFTIHIQKHPRGPVLIWNGHTFSNQHRHMAHKFPTAEAAAKEARRLQVLNKRLLEDYKVWVDGPTGKNPSQRAKLDDARRKLENFTGHPATRVIRAKERSKEKVGLVLGPLLAVSYEAKRRMSARDDGKKEWEHRFRKNSRPLLAVSKDGKQLRIVGGRYEFTEAGIEDRG